REGPVPIYKQLADLIREQIERGELKAGDPVPSEAKLEQDYEIARTTARRVARELREQGVAYTIQGEGTFVGPPTAPRAARKIPLYQEIAAEIAERIKRGELPPNRARSEEHTSELQAREKLVCRLLLANKIAYSGGCGAL